MPYVFGLKSLTNRSSEYLNMERQWHDRSPYVNQSLFNPEWIYGVSCYCLRRRALLMKLDDVSNHTEGQQRSDLAPVQCSGLRRKS